MEKDTKYKAKLDYVESLGMFFETLGLPRMAGRIFAWLLVCDPPHQTAAQIAEALGASRGSLSTNLRLLSHFKMIDKICKRGDRSAYFVCRPDSLIDATANKIRFFDELKKLLQKGIGILEAEPFESADRLKGTYEIYDFLEIELLRALENYYKNFNRDSE